MKPFKNSCIILWFVFVVAVSPVQASGLIAESHIRLELDILSISIDGAQSRLEQLKNRESADKIATSPLLQTHQRISKRYRQVGTNPGRVLVWENHHRREIETWLAAHPEARQTRDALQQ